MKYVWWNSKKSTLQTWEKYLQKREDTAILNGKRKRGVIIVNKDI